MNELLQPCELQVESISLLAADCLTTQEGLELHQHFVVCDACRQRFEEIKLVCSNVRTAKPVISTEYVLAIERLIQNIPSTSKSLARKNHFALWRITVLTAAVLVLVGLLNPFTFWRKDDRPSQPTNIVQVSPHRNPQKPTNNSLPTMFTLRRAAAESDESLDQLIVQYSDSSLLEPLNNHTYNLELLR